VPDEPTQNLPPIPVTTIAMTIACILIRSLIV
jgi:hypothetical protein